VLTLGEQEKPKKEPLPVEKKEVREEQVIKPELAPKLIDTDNSAGGSVPLELFTNDDAGKTTVDNSVEKKNESERIEWVLSQPATPINQAAASTQKQQQPQQPQQVQKNQSNQNNSPMSAASGGYLAKPTNIYAEPKTEESKPSVKEPIMNSNAITPRDEDPNELHLVFKDDIPAADEPGAHHALPPVSSGNISAEDLAMLDEAEEQKRRAAERIQKLRNLSFNINGADPNNEFETVPAYIRRNLELYNTISSVENFYSNYEVKTDENNNTQISTLNTFLDGKKPD